MNNQIMMDMDPLSYEAQYEYSLQNPYYPPVTYPYKDTYQPEPTVSKQPNTSKPPANVSKNVPNLDTPMPKAAQNTTNKVTNQVNDPKNDQDTVQEDIKPDITKTDKKKKLKGRTSSYWNKKISDKDFAFYGCSVCDIAYKDLIELDQHVMIHTNRMTTYEIRQQNLKKRKRLKKLKKKQKKEKIKDEFDVEIKPEDGYIGMEKAGDVIKDKKDIKKDVENNKNKPENKNGHRFNVYKCFGCNREFALSYYLRIHVRSHTDEKPYTCNECGQSFITASKRARHNKRIHLSIRHQCRICFKFFNRFDFLVKHFDKIHADDKLEGEPYDYNTILPYLKELEQQMMVDKAEPKTEDPSDESVPVGNTDQNVTGNVAKEEEDTKEKKQIEVKKATKEPMVECKEIKPDPDEPIGSTTLYVPEQYDSDMDIKQEVEEPEEVTDPEVNNLEVSDLQVNNSHDNNTEINDKVDSFEGNAPKVNSPEVSDMGEKFDDHFGDDATADDDDDMKEERASNSDPEYFPSDSCSRPPDSPSKTAALPKPGKVTTCPVCNKSLNKGYLTVHMRTHTGEKPYICYICNRGFITASKMHRHVLTHNETWEEKFGGEVDENEKITRKSEVDKAKAKILKKPKKTAEKKDKSHKTRPHGCEYCHKRFLHPETLHVHRRSHAGSAPAPRCRYCLEPAAGGAALLLHEGSHAGPKPYLCTLCGNCYKKKETLVYHRKSHHSPDVQTFVCDICSKKFRSQTKFKRHIMSHSVEKYTLKYECPVCAHMFHTRYHVQMHLNTHMKEGLILEENRSAVLAMVLQNARKIPKSTENLPETNIPADERSRICNICGEIFQHFYYLEEHLKTHGSKIAIEDIDKEEEKKYTCQVCSKSFKLHYYLKLHSFTHTKEKPFICQQCGKGFITKGKLKRHMETHQGLKKYQCHICYKFFTRPSYLRIHVRTIHGTQDYNFRDYGVGVPIGAIVNS